MKLAALLFGFALLGSAQTLDEAERLWHAKHLREANNVFRELVKAHPGNPGYKVRWGRLLLEGFNRADSANLFKEALAQDPKNAGAMLGLALVAAENFDGSAADFARKAIAADPKLTEAQELLARLALEDNDYAGAREQADRALALDPHSLTAESVHAAADLIEHRDAQSWLARIASEHAHEGRGYEVVGYFLQLNRRYDDAIGYFQKALAAEPNRWSARSELGLNLMRLAREAPARKELELCYNNGFRNDATVNTLRLMDSYKDFRTFHTSATILKLKQKEADVLRLYIEPEFERALAVYQKKYEYKLREPVQLEVYPDHEDFAVRTMGMPGLGALGVTFQNVVAMDSPSGRPPGEFHWASTLWHELSHVYIIALTGGRVPRWFTEGVAVHEETATAADWGDRLSPDVITAIKNKQLLPIAELDRGFIHPKYPAQVVVSYWQAGRICDFIAGKWGERKLLEMAHAFAKTDSTAEVVEKQLGLKPAQFDEQFLGSVHSETKRVVEQFDQWKKDMREVNAAVRAKNWTVVSAKAPGTRDQYPAYVESGSAYQALAEMWKAQANDAKETETLLSYSRASGRNPTTLKRLASLLEKQGKRDDAAKVLERLVYIAPLDEELHTQLGADYLAINHANGAQREYRALVAGKAQDQAAAHFGLARALLLAHKESEAKDELLESLEAAPGFKPAQKLLLEMTAHPSSD